jgi:putative transposase
MLNATWFVVVSGVQWRLLPREYPCWQTVYYHFRRWSRLGYWKRVHHLLRALVRQKLGRHKHPTGGCLDSQSVKSTHVPGVRGFDSAKHIKGRKRHLLTDTQGLALEVVVTPADVSESQGARLLWQRLGRRRGVAKKVRRVWVDAGYKRGVQEWCAQRRGVTLQVVEREPNQRGFAVQPRRWVIERTFGWMSLHRRLRHDYEMHTKHSEAMLWITLSRVLLRRLA